MDISLIIYAVVAAMMIFWLKSLLGTKTGTEKDRKINIDLGENNNSVPKNSSFIDISEGAGKNIKNEFEDIESNKIQGVLISEQAKKVILAFTEYDKTFSIKNFILAAQDAFALIVESFASGDRDTLKNLLSNNVYNAFEHAISENENKGHSIVTEVHAVKNTEIIEANVNKSGLAKITIRFTASETCVIKDSEGKIISGHPDKKTEMIDVWTFSKDLRSRDPKWILIETKDDMPEDHKTPLPESSK